MKSLLIALLFSFPSYSCLLDGSQGILPKNNMWVPVSTEKSDMNRREFKKLIDKIARIYRPYFAGKGGRLVVKSDWHSGEVNAYAEKKGK